MSNDEVGVQDELEPTVAADAETTDTAAVVAPSSAPESANGAARLVLKRSGAETSDEFPVNPPAIIGRFDPSIGPIDVDLGSLPEGVYVSRKHAKITSDDGVWRIHDLGSSNGTFVLRNDFERIEEAEIGDGTEIAFGNARFVFRLRAGSEPAAVAATDPDEPQLEADVSSERPPYDPQE